MPKSKINVPKSLIGMRFGRLVVVSAGVVKNERRHWGCKCDCKSELVVPSFDLKSGHTKSCGCLRNEKTSQRNTTHGLSKTREFRIWVGMRVRCELKTNPSYKYYGGRGIKVCRSWRHFSNFFSDMGWRPTPKHTIERINNSRGYSPSNCKWATRAEQNRNKRTPTACKIAKKLFEK